MKMSLSKFAIGMFGWSIIIPCYAQPHQPAAPINTAASASSGISGSVPGAAVGTVGGPVSKGQKIDGTGMRHKR
jgi:hypothetical protein